MPSQEFGRRDAVPEKRLVHKRAGALTSTVIQQMIDSGVGGATIMIGNDETFEASTVHILPGDGIAIALEEDPVGTVTFTVSATPRLKARVVCTSNMDLSGTETVDGISIGVDEIALCVNQTDTTENGLQVVSATGWTRPVGWEPRPNDLIEVAEGTLWADTVWQLTNNAAPVVGTDAQAWRRIDGKAITQSVSTTVTISKHTYPRAHVFCTASAGTGWTLTPPAAADYTGGEIIVKATFTGLSGTNPIVFDPVGAETVDGAATSPLQSSRAFRRFVSDGSNWHIVG